MGMPALRTDWTVDMLDALEDDGQRYELIDGELFVTPSPIDIHQMVVGELHALLREYLRDTGLGKQMMSPSDVRRGDRTRTRVQPDVFVVRTVDGVRPPYPYDLSDLLLAVEVTSPSSRKLDYHIKRELYARSGVGTYWVIDADARTVSCWTGDGAAGAIYSDVVQWWPSGATTPFVLRLAEFFDDAVR
ncbi:MAG: Uma2 family endonuclease [Gemmatimonadaceae bacterium]|nr:Uma2 family endonuclease [Gemmatimonadaceae bacterium]